jgi:hypothetical protein
LLFANFGRPFLVLSCLLAGKVEGMTGIGGGAAALRVVLPHSAPLSSLARFSARVPLLSACGAFALGSCIRFRSSHASASWLFLVLSVFFVLSSLGPSPFILGSRLFVRNSTASIGGLCFSARAFALSLSRAFALGLSRTFALGLYLCSRLVPLLSACACALGL